MTIDLSTIDGFLFSSSYAAKSTELEKAKAISDQLSSSIDWLTNEAGRTKDHQKKNDLLMEAEAAKREFIRINKEIQKVENTNE